MLTALAAIAIFLVMISLHEFGHFIVAKLCGVTVLEFSIGMGPAIFKRVKKDTLYSVRALPIGGYCKMDGEDGSSENKGAFCNQKLWKRFLVVVAGAVMNIILGFVLFLTIVPTEDTIVTNTVASVDERSYMSQSGVMAGDRIVKINGHSVGFYRDITLYRDELDKSTPVEVEVIREGKRLKFSFMLSNSVGTIEYGADGYTNTDTMNGVTEVVTGGYTSELPEEYVGTTTEYDRYLLGFTPVSEPITVMGVINEAYNLTKYVVKLVYKSLWDLVRGKGDIADVSGPVGVVGAVNTAVKTSLASVIWIAALLSINLGVFNLLPLPALDGGRIMFMLYELIRRKPVQPDKEGMVHAVGLLLLFIFAALISVKDIIMLLR